SASAPKASAPCRAAASLRKALPAVRRGRCLTMLDMTLTFRMRFATARAYETHHLNFGMPFCEASYYDARGVAGISACDRRLLQRSGRSGPDRRRPAGSGDVRTYE